MKQNVSILLVIISLLMFLSIFLPYASATDEHAERLEKYADFYSFEDLNLDGKDLVNVSMFEYAMIYGGMSEELFGDPVMGIIYVSLVVLIAGFSLCMAFFAYRKKPVAIIIFDIAVTAIFHIQTWDYSDRGIVPSGNYNWGVAYYLFIFFTVAVFLISITTIIFMKKRPKKEIDFDSALDFLE